MPLEVTWTSSGTEISTLAAESQKWIYLGVDILSDWHDGWDAVKENMIGTAARRFLSKKINHS